MKQYLLGLDGGGTKTDALVCTLDGQVLRTVRGGPSSISGQSPQKASDAVDELLYAALDPLQIPRDALAGFYAGISGAGLSHNKEIFGQMFSRLLPGVPGEAGSDAANALSSVIALRNGTIAIAGTGASIQYRLDGKLTRISGWGYMLGDEGSGFDLGHRAVLTAVRSIDGRIGATLLRTLCEQKMGMPPDEWASWLYRQDVKTEIASYAPILLEAAESGDSCALEQLDEASGQMALAIDTAVRQSGSTAVVLGGSLWRSEVYRAHVRRHVRPEITFLQADCPPVCGAAVLAGTFAGHINPEELLSKLRSHYAKEQRT